MIDYFSDSYKLLKIKSLQEKITALQNEHDSVNQEKDNLSTQLYEVQDRVYSLESQYAGKVDEKDQKETELNRLQLEQYELEKQYQNIFSKSETAKKIKEEKERLLASINFAEIREKIEAIDRKINIYDMVIAKPAPKPEYRVDGEYCENGIYHCKNHPPRQVQTNQDDILQFRQSIANARLERENLRNERNQLEKEYDYWQNEYENLQADIQNATTTYEELQEQLEYLQSKIKEIKLRYQQAEQERNSLITEAEQISISLSNARAVVYDITGEVLKLEYELKNIQNNLWQSESERENLKSPYENNPSFSNSQQNVDLLALAQQELMQEESQNQNPYLKPNDFAPSQNFDLMQLALKELQAEGLEVKNIITTGINELKSEIPQLKETVSHVAQDLTEKFVAVGGYKVGSIPGLIAQNLNFIGNINKKVNEIKETTFHDIDSFGKDLERKELGW